MRRLGAAALLGSLGIAAGVGAAAASAARLPLRASSACDLNERAHPVAGAGAAAIPADYSALDGQAAGTRPPQPVLEALAGDPETGGGFGRVLPEYDPDLTHLIASSGNVRFYFVPGRRGLVIPPGCGRTLKPSERHEIATLDRAYPPGPGYCVVGAFVQPGAPGDEETFRVGCGTLSLEPAGYQFMLSNSSGQPLIGFAPDDVARVEIRYPDGTVTTAPVAHDVFVVAAPPAARYEPWCQLPLEHTPRCTHGALARRARVITPSSVAWRNPAGSVLDTFAATKSYIAAAEETDSLTEPFGG